MHKLNQRIGKENKLELCKNSDAKLRDLKAYIPNLMKKLWDQPKLVVSVIEHADRKVLEEQLAPFFANNFYENILSSYYIEDNLMYVLTLLIQSEINKLTNIKQSDKFLDKTPCGILLGELRRKSDIQLYFNNIIKNAIEQLEVNNSTFIIDFNPEEINKYFNKKFSDSCEDDLYLKYPSTEHSESDNIDATVYIPDLDKIDLKKLEEENKNMFDYLNSKLSYEKGEKNFMNEILDMFKNQKNLVNYKVNIYLKSFMIVINFIDTIIKNIIENIHLIPHSIKYLCRIISEIIKQKFPNISIPDKNAFIAKFFFGKLLIPMFENPGAEDLINNFISDSTSENLKIISKILNKFASGMFYKNNSKESYFSPFNWYFISNSEKLFDIFKDFIKVKFPSFIDNLINNKLPPDYKYDYFKENPDEVINFRSIFFNLEQVQALAQTIDEYEREICKDEKNKIINKSIEKLLTTNNFEFNFTPFNWYFIKNSNKLFGIFKDLKKVRFPLFIDNLINNKLLSDYEYNYFKENPDEVINFRSIFFNLEQILAIVQTMNEFEREIFKDNKSKIRKAVEKLMTSDNQQLFEEIIRSEKEIKGCLKKDKRKEGDKKKKKNDENENKEIKSILHYFLITGLDSNEKYKNLFKIEEKKYFSLTELKELKDEKSITKNNIIKVKNLFFILLYNYHKLVKTDFGEGTTENTEKILKELYMFMKSPNFVMDGSIRSDWYVKSLLEYLKRLPEYLTKNDCEELYNEMENVLKESIKELDFEVLSDIKSKLKYANRSKAYYKQSLELLEDIESNEEARKIISNQFIPVDIKFEYDIGDENIFKIEKSKF